MTRNFKELEAQMAPETRGQGRNEGKRNYGGYAPGSNPQTDGFNAKATGQRIEY